MRLPDVAERLRELAVLKGEPELEFLAGQIARRKGHRGECVATPMSRALAAEIRAYARANPSRLQVEIARHFNVNQGRVSELLKGKRK